MYIKDTVRKNNAVQLLEQAPQNDHLNTKIYLLNLQENICLELQMLDYIRNNIHL